MTRWDASVTLASKIRKKDADYLPTVKENHPGRHGDIRLELAGAYGGQKVTDLYQQRGHGCPGVWRGLWSIENRLHGSLDVMFREDAARPRDEKA